MRFSMRHWAAAVAAVLISSFLPQFAAAQTQRRYAHSSSLAPDGNVYIIGGLKLIPALSFEGSIEIYVSARGPSGQGVVVAGPLCNGFTVARASHTATVLPNGRILVAGGDTGTFPATLVTE